MAIRIGRLHVVRWLPALFAVAMTSVSGCGSEPAADGSAAPTGAGPTATGPAAANAPQPGPAAAGRLTQEELDAVNAPAEPAKLALIVKTRNNPFFDPMIRAAESEAKALGVELEVQSPAQETDKERQFALVQDVAARGVQAILIAPADSKGIVPALKQAADRGILIVNLDNRVDPAAAAEQSLQPGAYIGADNEAGGRLAGEELAGVLSPGAQVAVIEGIRGVDNAEARKRGFAAGVQGKLEIVASESAEWDTQKAYAKVQSLLARHPDLKGIFCANDKMALGAIRAISEAGKKGKVRVIGYDNIPDVQPYLKSKELYATIEQHPDLMGKYGVRAAVGLLSGALKPGKEFLVPLEVVPGR